MKRKLSFKAPFVTTFAAAATVVACGGHIASSTDGTSGGPQPQPQSGCPDSPAAGDSCSLPSDTYCPTNGGPCATSVHCVDGVFQQAITGSCNPPGPTGFVCPQVAPLAGTSCFVDGGPCTYPDTCQSGRYLTASCSGQTWTVTSETYQVDCPATMPQTGDTCGACAAHYPSSCAYGDCQGQKNIFATCNPQTQSWEVTGASCNPPAVVDAGTADGG